MPSMDLPKIAVAGRAPYIASQSHFRPLWAKYSMDIEFEEMQVGTPSLGYMVDTLEFLPKAGVLAVDIWHPAVQAVTQATDWSESARKAGLVYLITFGENDFGLPIGHNAAFSATWRALDESGVDIAGSRFLIIGEDIPKHGVLAALRQMGAGEVIVLDAGWSPKGPGHEEQSTTGDAVDIVMNLSGSVTGELGIESRREPDIDLAAKWQAERMCEVVGLAMTRVVPQALSRDLAVVFADRARQHI